MRVSLILLILAAVTLFFFFNKGPMKKTCNCAGTRDPVYLDDPGMNLDQPIQYGGEWLDTGKMV